VAFAVKESGNEPRTTESGAVPDADERETGRVEAFSDGVLAIIITIMALELRAPLGGGFADLRARLPALLVYLLSFTFIGIYWNTTITTCCARPAGSPAR